MNPKENYVFEGGLEDINDLETHDTLPAPRMEEEITDSRHGTMLLAMSILDSGDDDYLTEES